MDSRLAVELGLENGLSELHREGGNVKRFESETKCPNQDEGDKIFGEFLLSKCQKLDET